MDKSGKIYVKAMNKYNDGYIDKALSLCEKSISINITNAAALNLKGILYYLKGDLENAKKMWNINYKRNNDEVSKKYLKDSIKDMEKLQLYVGALDLIVKLNISAALDILKQCELSHFNFINVNNQISLCYIKQGEYDKALHYINQVFIVDKKNSEAIANKKTLIEYGNLKPEINYKRISIIMASICTAIIILILSKSYINKSQKSPSTAEEIKKSSQEQKQNKQQQIQTKPQEELNFPKEQFENSIKNNDMDEIIGYVNQWKGVDLQLNDKLLMAKGEDVIKSNGIVYFYEKGKSYINDKKFIEAQKCFLDVLPYTEDNYLRQHIMYMLAICYKSTSDFQKAVEYYEIVLKEFPSGGYTEEILYNLILINKDVDINKAKIYRGKLIKQFPDSQYNNTIIKGIL